MSKNTVPAIVAAAGRLFKERGFDGIAVSELMADAGFTHGGFYNHFDSKADLAAAVTDDLLTQAAARLGQTVAQEHDTPGAFARYLARYLSAHSRDDRSAACSIAALGADVIRQDAPVRQAFAGGLRAYLNAFANLMDDDADVAPITALSAMVGALLLSRAVAGADDGLSDEILAQVGADLAKLDAAS